MPMKYIINGQYISILEATHLVAGSQDIYTAEFEFDETWDGFSKKAIFLNREVSNEPIEQVIVDGMCIIPWEVLEASGYLIVGVYGENDTKVMPTIYAPAIFIDPGVTEGQSAQEPTPSVWEQLLERCNPAGGEEGQVLAKASDSDYDFEWQDQTGGGTTDYADLNNKPQIEGITLTGDKSAEDLGLAKAEDIPDVSQFITKAVNDLVYYYTKNQTDAAIAAAIGSITEIRFEVVNELPETGENGVIYLVPLPNPEVQNTKAEYIYVFSSWEKIGETTVDLSNYYTKAQTDALLLGKASVSDLTNHTGDTTAHITGQERTTWNGKADASALSSHVGDTTKHITTQERTAWNEAVSDLSDHEEDTTAHITSQERTAWNGKANASDLTTHIGDTVKHITDNERTAWNGKANASDLTSHEQDAVKHITSQERTAWNGKADQSDLTNHTGDTVKHITSQERTTWNAKLDASALNGYATQLWTQSQGYLTQHQDITGKEDNTNKVTSLSSSSTDTQYPSAKCVYDIIGDVETLLAAL